MSQNFGNSNLSVALLLSELEDIKEISNVFRKLGVIPHFYEDLKSFWQGTIERMPALAIIDVKKMNEGGLILKNHPNVMTNEMPLLFFYSDKTEPLLVSTQEIFHLGTVKKAKNYEGIFKALLMRINKLIALEQENHHLKFAVQAKNEEIKKLENEKIDSIKINIYESLAREVIFEIRETAREKDFFESIEKVFQNVAAFESFSMVELSFNGQKLISPISQMKKFRAIPSLWLGQLCKDGIELFAQNMANQIALEVLGENVVSLLISGTATMPEKMIFIKATNEQCFNHFDWTLLENFLNGTYAHFKLRSQTEINSNRHFSSMYEAFTFLDQFVFGSTIGATDEKRLEKLDYRLVNLDLSMLSEILIKKGTQRFYWKKFRDDFISKVELQTNVQFRLIENGVLDFGFLVEANQLDLFFDQLKELSTRFPFWKYFENSENIMFNELKPKVTMIPISAYAYLKHIYLRLEMDSTKALKKNESMSEISWNRAENEI
jgi:hypothetical protein